MGLIMVSVEEIKTLSVLAANRAVLIKFRLIGTMSDQRDDSLSRRVTLQSATIINFYSLS